MSGHGVVLGDRKFCAAAADAVRRRELAERTVVVVADLEFRYRHSPYPWSQDHMDQAVADLREVELQAYELAPSGLDL